MELFPTGDAETTAPVLQRPGRPPTPGLADLREVPRSLRGRHHPVMNSPAELAARRKEAAARQAEEQRLKLDENYQRGRFSPRGARLSPGDPRGRRPARPSLGRPSAAAETAPRHSCHTIARPYASTICW
jgi:hypothetical protein